MRLGQLLKGLIAENPNFSWEEIDVNSIECDSRKVITGGLFIAMQGAMANGNSFIRDAVSKGARVIISDGINNLSEDGVVFLSVDDAKQSLRRILLRFYGDISNSIDVIGITGTNGKTTISYLIESILKDNEKNCGVIGTVNYRYGGKVFSSNNTTPGIIDLQNLLTKMIASDEQYCIMEVSSHALDQGRVDLIDFRTAIFTNLTSDHLDYHSDREHYFLAKAKLFTSLKDKSTAVINIDDFYGRRLLNMTGADVITYGMSNDAAVKASNIEMDLNGTNFVIKWPLGECSVQTPLIGSHNVYNILAAVTACLVNNISMENIIPSLRKIPQVPGRLEKIQCGQNFFVFIDYAHTEDALENVLKAIRQITKNRIILVFGCGGDRDKTKRPKMGNVASRLADLSIITSDNSRSEDTDEIISQILSGFGNKKYVIEPDRRAAIGEALREAQEGDVVLIAGKGHEKYQIFKDRTIEFDENKIVKEILGC